MRIVGIDPGFSGAWGLVVDGRPEACGDMPVVGDGTRKRVAAGVLAQILRDRGADLVVVELVGAMPKQGVASSFRFGMSYGAVLAVANVIGVPVELVTPQVWKKFFGLIGQEKEASRVKALDRAPWLAGLLERKADTGRAEAILIGLYGHQAYGVPKDVAA